MPQQPKKRKTDPTDRWSLRDHLALFNAIGTVCRVIIEIIILR